MYVHKIQIYFKNWKDVRLTVNGEIVLPNGVAYLNEMIHLKNIFEQSLEEYRLRREIIYSGIKQTKCLLPLKPDGTFLYGVKFQMNGIQKLLLTEVGLCA